MTKKTEPNYDELLKATQEMNADGFEGMGADTIALPFIRVLQDLSPACKKKSPDYVDGAEPGMLYNTITGEVFEGPVQIVVGRFDRTFLEWKPKRAGLAGVHDPASISKMTNLILNEKNQLIDPNTGNTFMDTYTYYVILPEKMEDGICLLSLSSTQLKSAKKLNRALTTTMIPGSKQKALPYFMIFELTTVMESNDSGDWFGVRFKLDKFVDQALLLDVTESRETMVSTEANYAQLEDKTGDVEVLDEDEPAGKF